MQHERLGQLAPLSTQLLLAPILSPPGKGSRTSLAVPEVVRAVCMPYRFTESSSRDTDLTWLSS